MIEHRNPTFHYGQSALSPICIRRCLVVGVNVTVFLFFLTDSVRIDWRTTITVDGKRVPWSRTTREALGGPFATAMRRGSARHGGRKPILFARRTKIISTWPRARPTTTRIGICGRRAFPRRRVRRVSTLSDPLRNGTKILLRIRYAVFRDLPRHCFR